MRANRRFWRWVIAAALPLVVHAGTGCEKVAGIYAPNPACANGEKDDGEEGIDCGGVCLGACPDEDCSRAADCASNHCIEKKCAAPRCDDSILNGLETAKDVCPDSPCIAGRCPPKACRNKKKDGKETAIDCGGDICPPCERDSACREPEDCLSRSCVEQKCACVPCKDAAQLAEKLAPTEVCNPAPYESLLRCACQGIICKKSCNECRSGADFGLSACKSCLTKTIGCGAESGVCTMDEGSD